MTNTQLPMVCALNANLGRLASVEGHMARTRRGIQSVEVGWRLLSALVGANRPLMLRDLAATADLRPAQAHAYLASFRRVGMVLQDSDSSQYELGPFALRLGIAEMNSIAVLRRARAALPGLAALVNSMVVLCVRGAQGPVVVEVQSGREALNLNIMPGTLMSADTTSAGLIFSAFGDETETPSLDEVRRNGFSTIAGLPVPGINSASAPIFDGRDLVASISLIDADFALPLNHDNPQLAELLRVARTISAAEPEKRHDD
ncbi:MAG: hypothetical protein EOS79_29610 [Mesorhizobium sp.]|nr:MAG: hypothetical protein EOS79_29610 [Mesorhizobium sp.]